MTTTKLTVAAFCILLGTTSAYADDEFDACPRHLLRDAIAQGVDKRDIPEVLSIEEEALTLCEKRTRLLSQVTKNDKKLQELRFGSSTDESEVETTALGTSISSPGLGTSLQPLFGPEAMDDYSEPEEQPRPSSGTNLRFFSVYGPNEGLRAGITDGSSNWHVRVGDTLPNGVKVVSISNNPISVSIREDGNTVELSEGNYAGN